MLLAISNIEILSSHGLLRFKYLYLKFASAVSKDASKPFEKIQIEALFRIDAIPPDLRASNWSFLSLLLACLFDFFIQKKLSMNEKMDFISNCSDPQKVISVSFILSIKFFNGSTYYSLRTKAFR